MVSSSGFTWFFWISQKLCQQWLSVFFSWVQLQKQHLKTAALLGSALCLSGVMSPTNGVAADIPSCDPESAMVKDPRAGVDPAFCAKWNPDFAFKGNRCCGEVPWRYRRRGIRCSPQRSKRSFCDERTENQVLLTQKVQSGEIDDYLAYLKPRFDRNGPQAQCSPTDGFLAHGKPILPTQKNAIKIRRPGRCVNYGTDRMVALLDWLGQKVKKKSESKPFRNPHLLVGDMSAPRGGCLAGRGGRRGHLSHQTGQDVDLGFLHLSERRPSPSYFTRRFSAEENWWFLKQLFSNEIVCIKIVLLDRRHIRSLDQYIQKLNKKNPNHPEVALWERMKDRIQHVRYHRDHYHIRIDESEPLSTCQMKVNPNNAS